MKKRDIVNDTKGRGTGKSAIFWSVLGILFVFGCVPASIWVADGLQGGSSEKAFIHPTEISDMSNASMDDGNYVKDVTYSYTNDTGSDQDVDQGSYYSDQTGNNYNEILIESAGDTVDDSKSMNLKFNINTTTEKLIDEDLQNVDLNIETQRNATADLYLTAVGYDGSSYKTFDIIQGESVDLTTDMDNEISIEVDETRVLEADNELSDYTDNQIVSVKLKNTTGGAYLPGDSVKWDLRLIHEESFQTQDIINWVSGGAGVLLIVSSVFATPVIDLGDFKLDNWFDD